MLNFIGGVVVALAIAYFLFGEKIVDVSFNNEYLDRAKLFITAEEGRVKEKRHEPKETIIKELLIIDNEDYILVLEWCEASKCEEQEIYVSKETWSATPRQGMYKPTSEDRLSDFNNEIVEREK